MRPAMKLASFAVIAPVDPAPGLLACRYAAEFFPIWLSGFSVSWLRAPSVH